MAEHDKIDIPEGRFPGNTYSSIRPNGRTKPATPTTEEEDEPVRQIKGNAKPQKKGLLQRLADAFIATDGKSIKDYMIFDVLIPGLKRSVEDIVHMTLYNDSPQSGRVTRSRGESRIRRIGGYNSLYAYRRDDDEMLGARVRSDCVSMTFDTQGDAEDALDMLAERIERNGFVSLYYFNTVTKQKTDWSQKSWGWHSMAGASVTPARNGFLLKLPRLEEL